MKIKSCMEFADFYTSLIEQKAKLSFGTAYKLYKLYTLSVKENEYYINEMRELLKQYAEKDENGNIKFDESGNGVKLIPETISEFEEKSKGLYELEVEGEINQIKLSLDELSNLEIDLDKIHIIEPFIQE